MLLLMLLFAQLWLYSFDIDVLDVYDRSSKKEEEEEREIEGEQIGMYTQWSIACHCGRCCCLFVFLLLSICRVAQVQRISRNFYLRNRVFR